MHIRFVVPALGLIALSATAASAQEIAKGVTLDGYLDTIATATTNDSGTSNKTPSTTDFSAEAVIKVGWSLADGKINSLVSTRTTNDQGSLALAEAYASIKATPEVTVSAGKSYGPFGYYSGYATGLTTINYALTVNMYTVNPVGAWLAYAPNEKVTVTGILADGFSGQNNFNPATTPSVNGAYKFNGAAYKASKAGTVSPGVDIVFNPSPELSLNVEGYLDPSAGVDGAIYFGGFNIQFKKDAILAAGEVLYMVNEGGKDGKSDSSSLSWAAFVTYTLPADAPFAGAVTGQLSQYSPSKTLTADSDTMTKVQLALLTNPLTISQFGLNYELFYVMDDKNNNVANKSLDSYGVAIEGLFVIP